MNEGRLQQVGTPDELYYKPANTFVAGFIGAPAANLIDADVVETGKGLELSMLGARFPLPDDIASVIRGATRVIFMARPEDIKISPGRGFFVYSAEWLGRETFAHIQAPDGTLLRVTLPPGQHVSVGEEVSISFDYKRVHFYRPNGELIL